MAIHPGAARRLVVLLLPLIAAAPLVADDEEVDDRGLPTPVELWRWRGSAQSLLAGSDLLFVAGKGRVTAIDPRDGEVAWSSVIGTESEDCGGDHAAPVAVGDRLFVPVGDSVAVLDTDDGTLIARVRLGGTVDRVLGPPVVAQATVGERWVLVRFDERSGAEVARIELPAGTSLERFGARFTVHVVEGPGDPDETTTTVLGLDEQLRVDWRHELTGYFVVTRQGEQLRVFDHWQRQKPPLRLLDPQSGELRPAAARALDRFFSFTCSDAQGGRPLDLEVSNDLMRSTFRRPGDESWKLDLPGSAQECTRSGPRLLVRLDRFGTRDLLAVARESSGRLENLLHLPAGVTSLLAAGDRAILVMGDDQLVAIDPLDGGPAEAEARTLAEAVAAVLAPPPGTTYGEILTDLRALGPSALPFAVAALPRLADEPLVAVAWWVAGERYLAAAAPLAAALDRIAAATPPPLVTVTGRQLSPDVAAPRDLDAEPDDGTRIAAALAAIAGPRQVASLARYASGRTCYAVLPALGRIATPEALQAVDRALAAARDEAGPWFRPPVPPAHGALTPTAAHAARKAAEGGDDDRLHGQLLVSARSAQLTTGMTRVLIFPNAGYGGDGDLWLAETPPGAAGGEAAPPARVYYLGDIGSCTRVTARVRRQTLEVDCSPQSYESLLDELTGASAEKLAADAADSDPEPWHPLRVPLGAWRQDSDGDTLTDLLERRLGLDPNSADGDGDGIADARDAAPNAQRRPAERRGEDELVLAALEGLWACRSAEPGPLFVVGADALEWRGRGAGPTITLGTVDSALQEWRMLRVSANDREAPPLDEAAPRDAPGERRVVVRHGPDDEDWRQREGVVLRRLGERWVITRFEEWYGEQPDR